LYGINSFVCAKLAVPAENADYYSNIQALEHDIQISTEKLSSKLTLPNYDKYAHIRNEIYLNPKKNLSAQDVSQRLYVSYGHFRATYKTYFDVSYHQDCIMSKISLAKHLLLTSTMSISSIANCCGYDDDKYFMHQFRQYTNCTPNQYRSCRHNSV
jgi:AraC-like DNA-binding protein